jgi:iron complex transport system substrate-binding protein
VVAVTHECDHPVEALALPRLTRSVLPAGLEPDEVDAQVREITGRGEALYTPTTTFARSRAVSRRDPR